MYKDLTSREARISGEKMIELVRQGSIKRDVLTGEAASFSEKEDTYIIEYSKLLKTRIFSFVLEC